MLIGCSNNVDRMQQLLHLTGRETEMERLCVGGVCEDTRHIHAIFFGNSPQAQQVSVECLSLDGLQQRIKLMQSRGEEPGLSPLPKHLRSSLTGYCTQNHCTGPFHLPVR